MRKLLLLALLALLLVAGGAIANEFAAPVIAGVPVPGDDPLTLRFSVSNRGWLLALRDVDFTCVPDVVRGLDAKGAPLRVHGAPFAMNVGIDLLARESFQYTCPILGPIGGPHLPARVNRIEAHVEMSFTRLGKRLSAHSGELVWDSQSKIWTRAK